MRESITSPKRGEKVVFCISVFHVEAVGRSYWSAFQPRNSVDWNIVRTSQKKGNCREGKKSEGSLNDDLVLFSINE